MKRTSSSLRVLIPILLIIILSIAIQAEPACAATRQAAFEPNEAILDFRTWVTEEEIQQFGRDYRVDIRQVLEDSDSYIIELADGISARSFVRTATGDPRIKAAQLNIRYQALFIPDDQHFSEQWGLVRIQAPAAWEVAPSSAPIIAVIDTGIDLGHPDFAGRLVPGFDFINNDAEPSDDNGHGTHVAGVIGAQTGNGLGVAGIARQVQIMPVKALDHMGIGNDATVASAIYWAADHGAKIINLSVGGTIFSPVFQEAVNNAHARGILVVSAAGNEGSRGNPRMYPAAYDNVLAVGATDEHDGHAYFSSFGDFVDVSAPGVAIVSTAPGGGYAWRSGTSMAAPHVSGLAALLWSRNPNAGALEIINAIQNADDIGAPGRDDQFGFGRINAIKALSSLPATRNEGQIFGCVVDARGQAITGTAVRVDSIVIPVNAQGQFRFTGVAPGTYTIYYDAPSYLGQKQEGITVNGSETRPPIVVLELLAI